MCRSFFICLVAVLTMSGCAKTETILQDQFTLSASVEADADSKVSADIDKSSSTVTFSWSKGDAVAVQTSAQSFSSYSLVGDGGREGVFNGSTAPVDQALAVFPASIAKSVDADILTIQLPAVYDYVPQQIDVPLVARVTDNEMKFTHLGALFCVDLADVPAGAKFVLTAKGRKINGEYQVDCSAGQPYIAAASEDAAGSNTVTVNFTQTQSLARICVPMPVGEYPSLEVKVLNEEGDVIENSERVVTGVRTFARKEFVSFPMIKLGDPIITVRSHAYNGETLSVSCDNIPYGQEAVIDFGDGTPVQTLSEAGTIEHQFVNDTGVDRICTVELKTDSKTVRKEVCVYSLMALTEAVKTLKDPSGEEIWVMAHRANTSDKSIPENSIRALNAAIAAGAHVVETDTHLTSDGEVVICHDKTIDRTTDGTGDITAMTLSDIRTYRLKDRSGNVTTEVMPTLREFLEAARGKIYVNLDYSPRSASTAQVMGIVQELGMMEQVFFYCNSAAKVAEVAAIDPHAHAYAWYTDYASLKSLPGEHLVQYGYTPDAAPDMGSALSEGLICTVNMLNDVTDVYVETEKLAQLKSYFPAVRLIQTDLSDKLLQALSCPSLPLPGKELFVSPEGCGDKSGSSWDNAMGMEQFRPYISSDHAIKIKDQCKNLDGATFHFKEGDYCTTTSTHNRLKVALTNYGQMCDITILGGYDSSSSGTDLTKRDVAANVTKFTGDRNGNGTADSGDTGIFCLDAYCNLTFDGCTFAHAYRVGEWRSGAFWLNSDVSGAYARLNLRNCRFYDLYDASSPTGGALAFIRNNSTVTAHNCDITGCNATSRGSAFRIDGSAAVLFLNNCAIHDNANAGDWGNAIQVSNGNLMMNNCTIARNTGRGGAVNGKGNWFIVNSTIINDYVYTDDTMNMTLRNYSSLTDQSAVLMNSIVLFDGNKPGIYIEGSGVGMVSGGYNLYDSLGGTVAGFPTASTDLYGQSLSGLGMQWNDSGYYTWNGPADTQEKAQLSDVETALTTLCDRSVGQFSNIGRGFYDWLQSLELGNNPLAYDQAGNPRNESAIWPGAYEKSSVSSAM